MANLTDDELLRRAVHGLKSIGKFSYDEEAELHPLDCSLAGRVARVFCIGRSSAIELCLRFDEDPDYSEAAERHKTQGDDDAT